jgi:hypothetical protein
MVETRCLQSQEGTFGIVQVEQQVVARVLEGIRAAETQISSKTGYKRQLHVENDGRCNFILVLDQQRFQPGKQLEI